MLKNIVRVPRRSSQNLKLDKLPLTATDRDCNGLTVGAVVRVSQIDKLQKRIAMLCFILASFHTFQVHTFLHLLYYRLCHYTFHYYIAYTKEKVSAKLHFKQGWTCNKYRNKAGMKAIKMYYQQGICIQQMHIWQTSCLSFLPSFCSRLVSLRMCV